MAVGYKYRIPSMVVAVADLVMTIVSIYLLVMFFFLAFALSSCLFNPKDNCSSGDLGGGGGRFGINFNFEQSSSSSYSSSHTVTSNRNSLSRADSSGGGDEDSEENAIEIDIDNRNDVIDFGKSFPGFGFDNKNRDSSRNKEVDLEFGIDSMDFGKGFGNRRNSENTHPAERPPGSSSRDSSDFGFGRKGNQNQKPSGFEWFTRPKVNSEIEITGQRNPDPRSRADFLKFETGDKEDKKVTGLTRVLFIIIVVVLWIFFIIAVIVEIIMLIAAIRLLMATKEGKHPSDALRSAKCWRIITIVLIVLFVLNFFGGSGRSNLESVVVGGANVLFRVIGVIIVSLFIGELEGVSQCQGQSVGGGGGGRGQVYYDVSGENGGGGGQMIPMNGNYNNSQSQEGGGMRWNVPKQV